jgi:hypothetical protein
MSRIKAFFRKAIRSIIFILTWPFRITWRGMKAVGRFFKRCGIAIYRSPVAAYRKVIYFRDKLLKTVTYLQEESAKWRTTFKILKMPYSFLRMMGLSPQMAIGLLTATSMAGTGAIVNETLLAEKSFAAGDAGVYDAPLDTPIFAAEKFNTLRLDLGSTPVGLVEITDTTLGTAYTGSALPANETNVIIVGGLPAVSDPAFTETFLEVGHMIVDRWRCETLTLSNIEAHELIISSMTSDGQSIAATAGTPRNRGINGGNRASDMRTSDSYYDQLKITSASSGVNGKIDVLRLVNLYSKGGGCLIDRVKAGTLEVIFGEIGGDTNLATKAFQVEASVVYKKFTNTDNVEVSMAVPPIQ